MANFVLSLLFFGVAFAVHRSGHDVLAAISLIAGVAIAGAQIGFSFGLLDAGGDPDGDGDGGDGDGGGGCGGD